MRYYKNMTKSEALKLFPEALKLFREYNIVPELKLKKLDAFGWPTNPSRDKAALREAWNNFTDALCKNRYITAKQYDTWSNPF